MDILFKDRYIHIYMYIYIIYVYIFLILYQNTLLAVCVCVCMIKSTKEKEKIRNISQFCIFLRNVKCPTTMIITLLQKGKKKKSI